MRMCNDSKPGTLHACGAANCDASCQAAFAAQTGYDYAGNNLAGQPQPNVNTLNCCACACSTNAQCDAFTFQGNGPGE